MACIAQNVNVISPLMTTKDGITKQATWCPLYLFSRYMRGWTISVHISCATLVDDGDVNVAVVNIHEKKGMETKVDGPSGEVSVFTVTGDSVTSKQYELEARSWCYGEYLGWKWFIHVH
ncbi:hypothetical protein EYZ11_000494 [Aspergillus tanneri]|uniref:Alpha-L-arabinofuranosidase C-terminal domain-containing protein n=1 Tax=Aspergillus tanneri TaxID=1220188 RepID=A0A4S3JX03_9EURO|nr:hypothetical protein EYZ11_000494 [Aspergillus tanneri]